MNGSDTGNPNTWDCIDCGMPTLPSHNGVDCTKPHKVIVDDTCEVYSVRDSIWERAGSPEGCLCIGCLEKRLGRELRRKDFLQGAAFNHASFPCTDRLRQRRERMSKQPVR